jgi:hypothetical protein
LQGGLNLLAFQVDANVARLMLPSQVDTTIIGSAELLWKGVDGSVVLSVRSDIHVSVVLRVRSGIHVSVVLSGRSGVHVSAALAMYQVCPFCTMFFVQQSFGHRRHASVLPQQLCHTI